MPQPPPRRALRPDRSRCRARPRSVRRYFPYYGNSDISDVGEAKQDPHQ
ncbi:hypothetical protein RLOC_00008757 [Lonchura striata]|uniref:Uncharacterized protein n=1 Tax=Lonchura striata TaxID=40157 RepID=A0A218UCR0_9PASE|nr:hypothetical protein RLOC_00008757 [Lonchura striata domestica]